MVGDDHRGRNLIEKVLKEGNEWRVAVCLV
jgi:hypothetical protein